MRLPVITWTRNRVLLAIGSVLTVLALILILVLGGGSPKPPSSTVSPPPSSATSGQMLTGGKVIAVKISNVWAARPPTALNKADIVYVVPIEGGYSRILAIYASVYPDKVGPVRSARETDLELLRQFGTPAFAYSGATPNLLPYIHKHGHVVDLYSGSLGYERAGWFRTSNKPAPHNLYANLKTLLKKSSSASDMRDTGFRFSGKPPANGSPISTFAIGYSNANFKFAWKNNHWIVYMDGKAWKDQAGKKRETASTVVIQYTKIGLGNYREYGKRPPLAHSVGSGKALVLRNGKAYQVNWSRPDAKHGTVYTLPTGERMTFAPGQTWIVLAQG